MVILITNNTFGGWCISLQTEGATEDVNLHVHKGTESSCNINAEFGRAGGHRNNLTTGRL